MLIVGENKAAWAKATMALVHAGRPRADDTRFWAGMDCFGDGLRSQRWLVGQRVPDMMAVPACEIVTEQASNVAVHPLLQSCPMDNKLVSVPKDGNRCAVVAACGRHEGSCKETSCEECMTELSGRITANGIGVGMAWCGKLVRNAVEKMWLVQPVSRMVLGGRQKLLGELEEGIMVVVKLIGLIVATKLPRLSPCCCRPRARQPGCGALWVRVGRSETSPSRR